MSTKDENALLCLIILEPAHYSASLILINQLGSRLKCQTQIAIFTAMLKCNTPMLRYPGCKTRLTNFIV